MDRHEGWATVICLIGGGQEINTGEAGIGEWISALRNKFARWHIHLPEQVAEPEYLDVEQIAGLRNRANTHWAPALHLAVSLRSFRAESLSRFVGSVLGNDPERAKQLMRELTDFPLYITRDLSLARRWIRERRRGPERSGLLASSNALRLKPEGIFVKATVDPRHWFLARSDDIRSSTALEDAATEFDVQGLELDWACVAWDANLRRENGRWATYAFKGTTWQNIKQDDRAKYLLNSYRVLLTRARQGMVIFVPKGEAQDTTRLPSMYDAVYGFLKQCGISELPLALPTHPEFTELGADPLLEFVQE